MTINSIQSIYKGVIGVTTLLRSNIIGLSGYHGNKKRLNRC